MENINNNIRILFDRLDNIDSNITIISNNLNKANKYLEDIYNKIELNNSERDKLKGDIVKLEKDLENKNKWLW
tara:strand:- start:228 stop:446 length:219 start_codon:yes stop_codon:yes gene_type:complete